MTIFEKISYNRVTAFFNRETTVWLGLCFLGIVGFFVVYASTPLGLGLREDSFSYVSTADNLASGTGLGRWTTEGDFRPFTHFPPLLPIFLTLIKVTGIEFLEAARLINASSFATTLILSGFLIYRVSTSKLIALAGACYLLCAPSIIELHAWLHSEPLFLVLCLIGLTLLAERFKKTCRFTLLFLSASFYGLSFLTRYAGISFIAAGAVAGVVASKYKRARAIWVSFGFFTISILPTLLFVFGNQLLYGNSMDRPSLRWHPPQSSIWESGARTMLEWFVDAHTIADLSFLTMILIVMILVFIFGLLIWGIEKEGREDEEAAYRVNTSRLLAYSTIAYFILIMATIYWFDRLTPLNSRILAPLFLFCSLFMISYVGALWNKSLSTKFIITCLFTVIVLFQANRGIQEVKNLRINGLGLTTWTWHASPSMQSIQQLPNVRIYTNDIPAIYFLSGRESSFIPARINPAEDEDRPDYDERLKEMHWDIDNNDAILVIIGPGASNRLDQEYMGDLTAGLCLFKEFQDGLFFGKCADPLSE